MINKILGIRRIGWRVQPIRHWRKNKKSNGDDGFEKYLEEAQHENNTPLAGLKMADS